MTQVQYEKATRRIVAWGRFPAGVADASLALAEVAGAAPLSAPGAKFLASDGTVTVVPPPQPTPDEVAAQALIAQQDTDDRAQARQAYASLQAERDLLVAQAPTAADVRRILLLLVRVSLALVRQLQRRGLV